MSTDAAQFVYMTCRPGAETALKREVARVEPSWRLAFSRPGFLTFKIDGPTPLDDRQLAERRWIFAHSHGLSLGKLSGPQLGDLAQELWRNEGVAALAAGGTHVDAIHVWQREQPASADSVPNAEDGPAPRTTPLALEIEQAIRSAAPDSLPRIKKAAPKGSQRKQSPPAHRGEMVLDVFVLEPGQWWIGYHRAVTLAARWPGGQIPAPMPAHAVSRAYAKLEEAIAWSGLPIAAGDECVEIGCAPGGACQAMLDRGLFVTGIDPADVDPVLLTHARFRHLKKRGKDVRRNEFFGVRWLVADMNIAPQATLAEIEPIVTHPGVTLRGLVLTLKLSDWETADQLDAFAERVRGWGFRDVRIRQLVSGGQEVCLVALRRKALRRLGRKPNQQSQSNSARRGRHRRTTSSKIKPVGKAASAAAERADSPHNELSGPHF